MSRLQAVELTAECIASPDCRTIHADIPGSLIIRDELDFAVDIARHRWRPGAGFYR